VEILCESCKKCALKQKQNLLDILADTISIRHAKVEDGLLDIRTTVGECLTVRFAYHEENC